jgi:cytidylate kinase
MASDCSALAIVREKLVSIQKKMGETKNIIMDGRDIGTNVLPDAEYKFFMTASPEERAMRRYIELKLKNENISMSQVLSDIKERDYNDSIRELNPLRKADDAIELDTTGMSIEEVINVMIKEIK